MEGNNTKTSYAMRALLIGIMGVLVLVVGHYGRRMVHGGMQGNPSPARLRTPRLPESEQLATGDIPSDAYRQFERYRTRLSKEDVIRFYEEEMPKRGWTAISAVGLAEADGAVLAYSNKNGDSCTISVTETPSGATVGILRARSYAGEFPANVSYQKEASK